MDFDIFDKFSPEARNLLVASQRYAEATRSLLGSEHILIAITVTPNSKAHHILRAIPLTLDQIRLVVPFLPIEKITKGTLSQITPEAKEILERAAFQSLETGAKKIEVEHLLWAIASNKKSRGYAVLIQAGIEPKSLEESLNKLFINQKQRSTSIPNHIEILGMLGSTPSFLDKDPLIFDGLPDFEDDEAEPSMLKKFATDLTVLAKQNKLDPLIGRATELERLVHILGRRTKNNPVLVGEPGVGKTAIVEGLAQKIIKKDIPNYLIGAKVLSIELSSLVAGTMYRGQFEERMRRLLDEIEKEEKTIIFIDEIHSLVGAGSAEGTLDAANILKPVLAKGKIQLVGATTTNEYRKYIEKDSALERRFQPIMINEPNKKETLAILAGLRERLETFHSVKIDNTILKEAIELSARFLGDRYFPDKAIDLLDEAAAGVRAIQKTSRIKGVSINRLERELKSLHNQKDYELKQGNFQRAAFLRDQEFKLKIKLKTLKKTVEIAKRKRQYSHSLNSDHLTGVISRWVGVPAAKLSATEREKLLKLEKSLASQIIGQDQALTRLTQAIKRSRGGLKLEKRPVGVFLLLGPTGVGKTKTAQVLANFLTGNDKNLIKLDMSEFRERHQAARLLGAPAGYVGYDETNRILEQIRRNPASIILFDEIEKAHPDIYNLLLQIMEDGTLTDSTGRAINFKESIILLTSNAGQETWRSRGRLGFGLDKFKSSDQREVLEGVLEEYFRPEFLSRLDDILVYNSLDQKNLERIVTLEFNGLAKQLKSQKIKLELSVKARSLLARKALQSKHGARTIRKLVREYLGNTIADTILTTPSKKQFSFKVKNQQIVVR